MSTKGKSGDIYSKIRKKIPKPDYIMDDVKYNRDKQKNVNKYIIETELTEEGDEYYGE